MDVCCKYCGCDEAYHIANQIYECGGCGNHLGLEDFIEIDAFNCDNIKDL